MPPIRLAGIGKSSDSGHHPPPPAASSSSSTLSPLAPPFTVDRWATAVANPNPYFVSTGDSVWSSSSCGSSRLTNLNSGVSAAEATRYFPYFSPGRDSLEKMASYNGYGGGWSRSFDLEEGRPARGSLGNSSWTESLASCQMSLALKKSMVCIFFHSS